MSREYYKQAMWISLEMRESGQFDIVIAKPLVADTRLDQWVIVAKPSLISPSKEVSRVHLYHVPPIQKK